MRILLINEVCGYTSTGRICGEIADELSAEGHEVKIAYGRSSYVPEKYQKYSIRIGNDWTVRLHALQTRIFDVAGFGSKRATKRFLQWADIYNPDIIWLHNLHGYYINIELLFQWIKAHPEKEIRWTLHDCWTFTGHCTHFTFAKCDKWKKQCRCCSQKGEYPKSILLDRSRKNYIQKKKIFCGVKNMTLITPSKWLSDLVSQSFLRGYHVEVRHNKIDEAVFKFTPSDFREKYGLKYKKIILGVANVWNRRKGLDDFIELSQMLPDKYAIVLVGLSPKQIKKIPAQIKGLGRTNNLGELAEIYSASDVYVNASREETFGMTTVEAMKCGARVIVYDSTASGEVVKENLGEKGGAAVKEGVKYLYKELTGVEWGGKKQGNKAAIIYCLPKTDSKRELAMLYSMADYFVNPTHEDNFPTTNLEAIACGTRVITYDVGGCRETIN